MSDSGAGPVQAPRDMQVPLCAAENSVLVLVDTQERLAAAMPEPTLVGVIDACTLLLQAAGILQVPVICSEQYPRGLGATLETLAEKLPAATRHFEKTCFSCAGATHFQDALAGADRRQVVVAGMEAHVCVLQTALQLKAQGLGVFVVEDAVCSRRDSHYRNAMQRLSQAGVVVTSSESVVFEWLRDARHDAFKAVAALLR